MQLTLDAEPESPDIAALNPSQNPKSPVADINIANNKAGDENLRVVEPQIPEVPKLGSLPSEQMRRHESFCQPNIKTPTCMDPRWDLGKGWWIHGNERQNEINITGCVIPITPDPFGENGDFHLDSPLTIEAKQLKWDCDSPLTIVPLTMDAANNENGSPRTPEDSVFDPFAPGPGHLVLAPQCRKYVKSNISISRRLDFPGPIDASHDKDESLSDQEMFEYLYEDLMAVIVSKQHTEHTEVTPNKLFPVFSVRPDVCPDAPIKVKSRDNPRNIEAALCKKLEF
ncbi:hypothetical protein PIB30_015728 [Stylosanthes scabra]|uniref:Uncharacterized protein n=1 Tax=Stylosanthes scabra TaxID=79078 RepID=A0ABU6W708_9FABA|nr:hypothetical protein [Stylosanthes scabra]